MERKPEEKSEDFARFEELTKRLVQVPKKDVQDREKKTKRPIKAVPAKS